MTVLEFFAVMVPSLLAGIAVSTIFFKFKKRKTVTAGDLYIFPSNEDLSPTYVAWETEPENFINEDYVLLKVMHGSSQE